MKTTKKATGILIRMDGSVDLVEGAIITSDEDAAVGTYCPHCKKIEITSSIDMSKRIEIQENSEVGEPQNWSVTGSLCLTCRLFWCIFTNKIGRRVMIYQKKIENG